jgi:enoyl-CoA hydratase/carnithine racemase
VPSLEHDGDIAVLNLGDDENRFSVTWLDTMHGLVDQLEAMPAPSALVTVADGKFWSNGLDLDWLTTHPDDGEQYIASVQRLFSRVLVLGMPTVAAVQGHCFAAGAMLALAHDWRVMRDDRGFFCLPEVDIGLPFSAGMDSLIRAKLPISAAFESMITGRRYGGSEAAVAGIVNAAVPEQRVREVAFEVATPLLAKAGPTLATIKSRMYRETVALLSVVDREASAP